jgi:hypothetical protein
MALADDVQNRVKTATLVQLTNPNDVTATTVDTTQLGYAVADAEAEFTIETGLSYDTTIAGHVLAGVSGVLYYLHSYAGMERANVEGLRTRWENALRKVASTLGNERRIMPTTSSVLDPSDETQDARPDHDRQRWDGYTVSLNRTRSRDVADDN